MSKRVLSWRFTHNDFNTTPYYDLSTMAYLQYQIERAPVTNHLHLEGFVKFHTVRTLNGAKELLRINGAHMEPVSTASEETAKEYTEKDEESTAPTGKHPEWRDKGLRVGGTPVYRYGTYTAPRGQGSRSDLDALKRKLEEGSSLPTIFKEHTHEALRYSSAIRFWHGALQGKRSFEPGERPKAYFLIGHSGAGKSRAARAYFPDAPVISFSNGGSSLWFDGYSGEETAIFDDFRGSSDIPFSLIKRIIDWYPLTVQTKGSSVQWRAKTMIFTSTLEPSQWYLDPANNLPEPEWQRRIDDFGIILRAPFSFDGDNQRTPGPANLPQPHAVQEEVAEPERPPNPEQEDEEWSWGDPVTITWGSPR